MSGSQKYKNLEDKLKYKFRDGKLLIRALTHASVRAGRTSQQDNERLEFVGDRVLGLTIAECLYAKYPKLKEGEMARRFNRLVSGESCAQVARSIDLGTFVILADSEADSGGRDKDTILADAVEAILGAVFIESGFDEARKVVMHLWQTRFESISRNPVDPKSALQEWAQGRGLPLPSYLEVSRSGPDHAPHFETEVQVKNFNPARARGPAKRQAEQAAARAFLVREGIWKPDQADKNSETRS